MSNFSSSFYTPGFDTFSNFDLKQASLEFASFHSPADIVTPDPESFEVDIDNGLQGCEDLLQVFTGEPIYSIPRGSWGPPSTFTSSGFSESASEDIFSDVASSYYGPPSSSPQTQDILNIEMEFQRVRVAASDYGVPQSLSLDESDSPFGPLPPTPPRSPSISFATGKTIEKGFPMRGSYSDYGGHHRRSSVSSDFFSQLGFNTAMSPSISPLHISPPHLPVHSSPNTVASSPPMPIDDMKIDSRRKYKCPSCPRAFARAYNLKTHMGTHDPNRLKPHVCPHRSCGRSFSRKHDLGRHLVSIHRDESIHSAKKAVGVASGERTWCDTCGKGSIGRQSACSCHDVK